MSNKVITNESGQIQTREERIETVQAVLQNESVKNALTQVLPNHIDPVRFARIAMTSLRNKPQLLQCNPSSFLSALLQSATLGLEPDTALAHSYIIPYGKEATLIVGYEGYIDLAYRSGVVMSIHANVVREGEEFDWGEGSAPYINHKPTAIPQSYTQGRQTYLSGRDVTHAYAVARLVGGGHVQVVMTKAEIDAIKSRSRASHDGPWVTDPVAMQKKTAIRQLRKFLPMSPQARALHIAAGIDEQADAGLAQTFDVPADLFKGLLTDDKPDEEAPTPPIEADVDDSPSEYGRCPLHKDKNGSQAAWALNKYGFSHRVEGEVPSVYCSPSKVALHLIKGDDIDEVELKNWLQATYGISRSQMEPEHLEGLADWLEARLAPFPASEQNPEPKVDGIGEWKD